MGNHDRALSREIPCADICLEVILPDAVCIVAYWETKGDGGKNHHGTSAIFQARGNRTCTGMMVAEIAGRLQGSDEETPP